MIKIGYLMIKRIPIAFFTRSPNNIFFSFLLIYYFPSIWYQYIFFFLFSFYYIEKEPMALSKGRARGGNWPAWLL